MDYLNLLTDWLYLHPHWAGVLTFFISFAESLAVVGLIIPGSVMMTTIGALIGSGVLPATETIIWAILGAIAGDSASYWLGHHYHEQLKRFWPFRTHPHWLERGESFFLKHGGKSVFIARFAGPMRPILPVVAGMLNMQPRRFIIANVISAIAWAPTYMLPGMVLGFASLELAPETLTRFILITLGVLIAIWLAAWLLQHVGTRCWRYINKELDNLWIRWAHTPLLRPLTILLRNPHYKAGHGQLTLGLFLLFTLIVFGLFSFNVFEHGISTQYNEAVWHFFRGLRHPSLDKLVLAFTYLGEKKIWLPTIILTFMWLWWLNYRRAALHWLALGGLSYISVYLVKLLLVFKRPGGLLLAGDGYSFPSGHATLAVALFGFLGVIIAQQQSKTARKWILYIVSSLVLLVSLTRLYIGAHWLTDVIGGALLGLIWLGFITLCYHRQDVAKIPGGKLLTVVFIFFSSSASFYIYKHYQHDLLNIQPQWAVQSQATTAWWQSKPLPVIYRMNRLNKPEEVLNIQWADKLTNVEAMLRAQGWRKMPKTNLNEVINRIAAKDSKQQLPLLANLYHDRAPSLVMVKKTDDEDLLLVLRLWHSGYMLQNPQTVLWYGSVSYNKLWHHSLFRRKRIALIKPARSAMDILLADVGQHINYKWASYTYPEDLVALAQNTDDKRVLLIKNKKL